jgi:hypothetical protein
MTDRQISGLEIPPETCGRYRYMLDDSTGIADQWENDCHKWYLESWITSYMEKTKTSSLHIIYKNNSTWEY